MAAKVVLFDVENTLIREWKDVSQYYIEAIRNSYGLSIDLKLSEYEGLTVQEAVHDILSKNGLTDDDIKAKSELFLQELPYAHYNVAGHDKALLSDGTKNLLNYLRGKGYTVGAASGQMERILKNMFERAGLNYEEYFRFGAYADSGKHISDIIGVAIGKALNEFGAEKDQITFISNSNNRTESAKSLGINAIFVGDGSATAKNLKECEKLLK